MEAFGKPLGIIKTKVNNPTIEYFIPGKEFVKGCGKPKPKK